ncbi:hypothetical protein ACFE04_011398 [Oxalis oulophora]
MWAFTRIAEESAWNAALIAQNAALRTCNDEDSFEAFLLRVGLRDAELDTQQNELQFDIQKLDRLNSRSLSVAYPALAHYLFFKAMFSCLTHSDGFVELRIPWGCADMTGAINGRLPLSWMRLLSKG